MYSFYMYLFTSNHLCIHSTPLLFLQRRDDRAPSNHTGERDALAYADEDVLTNKECGRLLAKENRGKNPLADSQVTRVMHYCCYFYYSLCLCVFVGGPFGQFAFPTVPT